MKKFRAAYTFLKYNLVIIFPAMAALIITCLLIATYASMPYVSKELNNVSTYILNGGTAQNFPITNVLVIFSLFVFLLLLLVQLIYMPLSGIFVEGILKGNRFRLKSYRAKPFKGVGQHFKSYTKSFLLYYLETIIFVLIVTGLNFISALPGLADGSNGLLSVIGAILSILLIILFAIWIVFNAVADLWYPIMFIEHVKLLKAVKLSWKAIKNKFWSLMGMYIFYYLIFYLFAYIALMTISIPVVGILIFSIIISMLILYKLILYSLFYIENRDKSLDEIEIANPDSEG